MSIPGQKGSEYQTNGLEHGEMAHIAAKAGTRGTPSREDMLRAFM